MKYAFIMLIVLFTSPNAFAQAWTHAMQSNPGPMYNQDVTFDGAGPNFSPWKANLDHVMIQGGMEMVHPLEDDAGTVTGGGTYVGQYKRSEVDEEGQNYMNYGNWDYNNDHRSTLSWNGQILAPVVNFVIVKIL